ncbi:MAG: hypothetical protein H0W04_04955 [Chthoniobacterales bacterium]|nr:hypothetical protein [Chthoniobacterales bacterium]
MAVKVQAGRVIIIRPFDSAIRRPTKETAAIRNRLVIDLATRHTIIHATPGGVLDRLMGTQTPA